eukprot:m.176739 g.176739  ORF g.176739 m.176739 type:complete len:806 (+) comp13536_c0_seq3:91-2508(+)
MYRQLKLATASKKVKQKASGDKLQQQRQQQQGEKQEGDGPATTLTNSSSSSMETTTQVTTTSTISSTETEEGVKTTTSTTQMMSQLSTEETAQDEKGPSRKHGRRNRQMKKSGSLSIVEESNGGRSRNWKRGERASFRINRRAQSSNKVGPKLQHSRVTWKGIVNEIKRLERERRFAVSHPSRASIPKQQTIGEEPQLEEELDISNETPMQQNPQRQQSINADTDDVNTDTGRGVEDTTPTSEEEERFESGRTSPDVDDDGLDEDDINSLLEKIATVVNFTEESSSHSFSDIMSTIQQKQFDLDRATLEWSRPPKNILVIKKLYDEDVTEWFIKVTSFLVEKYPNVKVFFPPQMVTQDEKDAVYENKPIRSHLRRLHTWRLHDKAGKMHDMPNFDLIITLGGDGTLLHVSHTFQKKVPPVISFALGSLGFLTQFNIENYKSIIDTVLDGGLLVTLRSRLHARLIESDLALTSNCEKRHLKKKEDDDDTMSIASTINGEEGVDDNDDDDPIGDPSSVQNSKDNNNGDGDDVDEGDDEGDDEEEVGHIHTSKSFINQENVFDFNTGCDQDFTYEILNEIVVDRGPSPYLTKLLVFVGDVMVTTVQGDGLIVATPTGSTAYSLAAGGSMCHPSVPCVLITPICPHSLSFRPIIVPASVPVRIKVPLSARNPAYVSFDGRNRQKLDMGMSVVLSPSRHPIPTISRNSVSTDWFRSLSHCLGWNIRESQKAFHYKNKKKDKKDKADNKTPTEQAATPTVVAETARKLRVPPHSNQEGADNSSSKKITFKVGSRTTDGNESDESDSIASEV